MCSVTEDVRQAARQRRLGLLVRHARELTDAIAAELLDPETRAAVSTQHVDASAAQLRELLATVDRARAASAVVTGVVHRAVSSRQLIEGTYASTRRFLEVEGGLSPRSARELAGRAHDLADAADYGDPRVRDAWLAGRITDDAVRELTLGVRGAVRHLPVAERGQAARRALDLLLPLASSHGVTDVSRAVQRLRFVLDPDGVRQAELDAYTEQSLTCVPVGHLVRVRAFLSPEAAAAVMTVLEQQVDSWRRDDAMAAEDHLPHGVAPDSAEGRRLERGRVAHLRALALGEVMTGLLDRGDAGLHHGIRPHTVLHVDVRDLLAGLGGELTMPGQDDPVLVPTTTVRRILCDTGLTHVVTRTGGAETPGAGASEAAGRQAGWDRLPDLLRRRSLEVLYVGREERTAPPRLRRALEARDRHCQAPGCRRHPRRCQAHHVQHWEHGGETSVANCVLLCERHHRALHSGQLTITRDARKSPTETGYFCIQPPDPPPIG
jgi:hypothetical protein